jgi:hypothetical protein
MSLHIDLSTKFPGITEKLNHEVSKNPIASKHLDGVEFKIGLETDHAYALDGAVMDAAPVYVSPQNQGVADGMSEQLKAMAAQNAESVGFKYVYNRETKQFDRKWADKGVSDAAPNLIAAQLLSPASAGWFTSPFKQVLSFSQALKFVSVQTGNNPWATVMNLGTMAYNGMATVQGAGGPLNTDTQDVTVKSDAMTQQVVNMEVTYKMSIDEIARNAQGNSVPWIGTLVNEKQKYARWALDMFTSNMILYGNTATGTLGLLTIAGSTAWSGSSMSVIAAGGSTTKGADMYVALSAVVNTFLNNSLNKLNQLKIGLSVLAYNILATTPYSQAYNPNSVLKVFVDNYAAGAGLDGYTPSIEFYPEPLFQPSTVWNSLATDYMVICAPEITGGVDEETQPLILAGIPLMDFVYPTIPGAYQTQYKYLRRYAGVFAPYTPALKVYTGFGV